MWCDATLNQSDTTSFSDVDRCSRVGSSKAGPSKVQLQLEDSMSKMRKRFGIIVVVLALTAIPVSGGRRRRFQRPIVWAGYCTKRRNHGR